MKIPTLIGVALLVALIAVAGLYFYSRSEPETAGFQISDASVVNISNTSATIIWQTSMPAKGEVIYSESEPMSEKAIDNRDRRQVRTRLVHFVTLNNLKPGTRYLYKIKNDSEVMQSALEFKTANIPETEDDELNFSFIKPLKGTILNTNLNPVDESLVYLNIPGAQKLATFSSTAGNFIMPLKSVLSRDLEQFFIIAPDTLADLTIKKGFVSSDIKILISEETVNLPPIPLGSSLDLSNFKPQPITNITFGELRPRGLDFNGDGKINSLDLAMLRETAKPGTLLGTEPSKFDVNADGAVDQKDVDQFSRGLIGN